VKCGLRMKKQFSCERVDECHASVGVKNKAPSDETVRDKTRERYDSASHDKHRRCYAPDTTENYTVTVLHVADCRGCVPFLASDNRYFLIRILRYYYERAAVCNL
jgi:hypothetical protein